MTDEQTGKIHIDADWKTEAAQEKERLVEQEREAVAAHAGADGAPVGDPGFAELINMLVMQAALAMGGYQGPGGEAIPPNLEAAKQHIDMLEVLAIKTKGNLSAEEDQMLKGVLQELRTQYVRIVSAPAAAPPPQA